MTKTQPIPADALRDRLTAEREALLPALAVDLTQLREALTRAAAAEREDRDYPTHSNLPNRDAIALNGATNNARDQMHAAEDAARNAERRIAEIDAVLGAAELADTLRAEAATRATAIAALIERREALTGALAGMRAEADALDKRLARELDAAADREIAARIAGKPVAPAVAPDATASELARLRATIRHAEAEITSGADRVAALRSEAREAQGRYYAARYLAARLELDAALLALHPLRVTVEAARALSEAPPETPAPLDALAVRRAVEAMMTDLPRMPADSEADAPAVTEPDDTATARAVA